MRRFLLILGILIALGGAGFGLVHFRIVSVAWPPRAIAATRPPRIVLTNSNSTLVTESNIVSNLAGTNHFIRLTVAFRVANHALSQAGGSPTNATSSGTGSPSLDARIQWDINQLCRETSITQLQTPAGMLQFRRHISALLVHIFGADQVGAVYFPSLMTQ